MPTECAGPYTYERFVDPDSGEVYAVQLTSDGRIVAAAGPIHYADTTDPDSLHGLISNAGPAAQEDGALLAHRFAVHRGDAVLCVCGALLSGEVPLDATGFTIDHDYQDVDCASLAIYQERVAKAAIDAMNAVRSRS